MRPSDWNDTRIRAAGLRYATDAYDLASQLADYGADAERLIRLQRYASPDVTIPAGFADALMAILLALSGSEKAQPHAGLGENVVRLKPRSASTPNGFPYCPTPTDAA